MTTATSTSTDDAIASAVAAALGPLLADKDIAAIDVVEGGLPDVVRRGRRERLPTLLEGPLCEIVREAIGARAPADGLLDIPLPGGASMTAAILSDGRVALRVRRAIAADTALAHLVEEGLVPAGVDAELAQAPLMGLSVVVIGPAQVARARLAVAVARAAAARLRVVALTAPVPAQCMPAPAPGDDGDVLDLAVRAARLGADVVCADVSLRELVQLTDAVLPVPTILACAAPSVAAVRLALARASLDVDVAMGALGLVAVCGLDAEGRPRLLELHGDAGGGTAAPPAPAPASMSTSSLPTPTSSSTTMVEPEYEPALPREASGYSTRRTIVADEQPGLAEAPPAEWASEDIDDDPGWELGPLTSPPSDDAAARSGAPSSPPAPGSFDAALQAVSKRPGFQPKSPAMHPQAAALRGTGGLTFEPPGGSVDDE